MAEKPLQAEIKKENRIVSEWLLHYHDRLEKYEEYKANVAVYPGQVISDDIRAQGVTSNPTQKKAMKMLEFKYDPGWFSLIEELERRIPEKQIIFLQVRREARNNHSNYRGRPGWTAYVQCKYPLAMADQTGREVTDFYISDPKTFTEWWNRLVNYGVRLAIKRGLL